MKKTLVWLFTLCLITAVFGISPAFAKHGKSGCPLGSKGSYGRHGGGKEYSCPVTAKFMTKAHFFLENQKELGLSDEQVSSIKELKLWAKKAYVQQMSALQMFSLDVDHKLSQPKVDVEGTQAMIDEFSGSMAAAGKDMVASYAKLKAVLTEEQLAKAKTLWMDKKA